MGTVGGLVKRCIEQFAAREVVDAADPGYFVDSGVSWYGEAPVSEVDGLGHLNGRAVLALVDGAVQGPFTVTGGAVTLSTPGTIVHVGLGITAELETLDLDVVGQGSIRDVRKSVKSVALLLEDSMRGFQVGPPDGTLVALTADAWDTAGLFTGREELAVHTHFNQYGRVLVRHTNPTPLTVLGVLPHVDVGG